MSKSAKQILSVLFHLVVLGCMVLIYDAGALIVQKIRSIQVPENVGDFMEHEETLSTVIYPELQKLVVKKDDGYLFRTDIAFPPHLKVVVTDVTKFRDVNMAKRIGDESVQTKLNARLENVMEYEMAGKSVRFTQIQDIKRRKAPDEEQMAKLKAAEEAAAAGEEPPEDPDQQIGLLVGKAVQFNFDGIDWKAVPTKEFKTMAWGKTLEPDVTSTLVYNGLKPRAKWFGVKPLPIGHKLKLAGESLNLVFENAAKGSLEMEFKSVEGVHGHPCAVFDVSGSIELKTDTDEQGQPVDGEETIESGRVWFSLLYPVVMRSELHKVVSYDTRKNGKLVAQFQGKAEDYLHRDWKAVSPQSKTAGKK